MPKTEAQRHGYVEREGMVQAIRNGGSVLFEGRVLLKEEDVPSLDALESMYQYRREAMRDPEKMIEYQNALISSAGIAPLWARMGANSIPADADKPDDEREGITSPRGQAALQGREYVPAETDAGDGETKTRRGRRAADKAADTPPEDEGAETGGEQDEAAKERARLAAEKDGGQEGA
jgi:hypothetical protein